MDATGNESDVAQLLWGVRFFIPIMVDDFEQNIRDFEQNIGIRVPRFRVGRLSGDERGFDEYCSIAF